jgi:hypothetical protein
VIIYNAVLSHNVPAAKRLAIGSRAALQRGAIPHRRLRPLRPRSGAPESVSQVRKRIVFMDVCAPTVLLPCVPDQLIIVWQPRRPHYDGWSIRRLPPRPLRHQRCLPGTRDIARAGSFFSNGPCNRLGSRASLLRCGCGGVGELQELCHAKGTGRFRDGREHGTCDNDEHRD